MLTESVFEIGMGTLTLARGATPHHLTFATFLLDTYFLGIKDVVLKTVDGQAFDMYMQAGHAASPMVSVDPSYARKLLRDRRMVARDRLRAV